ncbi:MAG TPA: hypothetical protein ENJ35_08620 [Gammaproteobacteria bacterium]|nr:hypothetical protein [Gammaproteobacteria bacterium]
MDDLKNPIAAAATQMKDLLAAQTAMQTQGLEYTQKSALEKMKFDFQKAGIERMSDVGEAISRMTERQSQQIAQ